MPTMITANWCKQGNQFASGTFEFLQETYINAESVQDALLSVKTHSILLNPVNPQSAKFLKFHLEMEWADLWQLL